MNIFRVVMISLVLIAVLAVPFGVTAQEENLPAGLVEFCEENPAKSVRHKATDTVYDCSTVLQPFEVVEEAEFEVVEEDEQSQTMTARVISSEVVNFRSAPSLEANVIEGINPQTEVEVLSEEGDWTEVRFNGQVGFVATRLLSQPTVTAQFESGEWEVEFFEGSTEQMEGWFEQLQVPAPALWPRFPNVDNPEANFVSANGLEYGLDESVFMEQNETGQFPVQARGYRLISGDYDIPGIDSCEAGEEDAGCAIAIFNVGEVTADIEGWVRQGFTVPGRYWNGDTLEVAMWALASHASANMLNMETFGAGEDTLNQPDRTNAGANCSVPDACNRVRFVIVVTSGNQILVKATTFVERTQ